jgi:hypothetical protein
MKAAHHSSAPTGYTGYTVEPAPSWVTPSPNAEENDAESSAPMSYRVVDEQYQLGERLEAHYLHIIRAINQSTGLDRGSRIEILFDPSFQKLVLHRVELVRAGKRLMDTAVRSYLESVEFLPAELNGTALESVASLPVVSKLDQNVSAPAFGQR